MELGYGHVFCAVRRFCCHLKRKKRVCASIIARYRKKCQVSASKGLWVRLNCFRANPVKRAFCANCEAQIWRFSFKISAFLCFRQSFERVHHLKSALCELFVWHEERTRNGVFAFVHDVESNFKKFVWVVVRNRFHELVKSHLERVVVNVLRVPLKL